MTNLQQGQTTKLDSIEGGTVVVESVLDATGKVISSQAYTLAQATLQKTQTAATVVRDEALDARAGAILAEFTA
jgi:hypothetical protein